jgi:hypothetical protein
VDGNSYKRVALGENSQTNANFPLPKGSSRYFTRNGDVTTDFNRGNNGESVKNNQNINDYVQNDEQEDTNTPAATYGQAMPFRSFAQANDSAEQNGNVSEQNLSKTAAALAAALASDKNDAVIIENDIDLVTLEDSAKLIVPGNKTLILQSGSTLTIPEGYSLVIEYGATLQVDGIINNLGSLEVYGTLTGTGAQSIKTSIIPNVKGLGLYNRTADDAGSRVISHSIITFGESSTLAGTAQIEVIDGVLSNLARNKIWGSSDTQIIIFAGSSLNWGSSYLVGSSNDETLPVFTLAKGIMTFNKYSITLDGSAILNSPFELGGNGWRCTLVINGNLYLKSDLTVNDNGVLISGDRRSYIRENGGILRLPYEIAEPVEDPEGLREYDTYYYDTKTGIWKAMK